MFLSSWFGSLRPCSIGLHLEVCLLFCCSCHGRSLSVAPTPGHLLPDTPLSGYHTQASRVLPLQRGEYSQDAGLVCSPWPCSSCRPSLFYVGSHHCAGSPHSADSHHCVSSSPCTSSLLLLAHGFQLYWKLQHACLCALSTCF